MSQHTIARRYATALYQEAEDNGVLEAVDDDVLMLRESLESNRELSLFFESPVISQEKKDTILQELLGDRVHELTVRFLRLLVEKDRETMTKTILDAYQTLRDEQRGIVDAHVTVAHELNEEDREQIVERLEQRTGNSVRLHVEENPDLIGGVVVRVGDRVFDGSVRNKLTNLHHRLRDSALSLDADEEVSQGDGHAGSP